jgi:hypothetical protein
LQREGEPAIYVYHQAFSFAQQQFTRRGFMARVRLERFGEGHIYPHEETHSAAKADRLQLTRACRANLSQIFGLYPDQDNQAQQLLEQAIALVTPKTGPASDETKELVDYMREQADTIPFQQPGQPDKGMTNHVLSLQDQLRDHFGVKVEIRVKGKDSGRIVLHFTSNDEFERIVRQMRQAA